MRYHSLRFDIWLCLALSVLLSFIPVKIAEKIIPKQYEKYVEEHTVENGAIGGIADENVHRAQNIEELLSHDTFTVISPGIEYRNRGAGYHGKYYMQALTLPSGEKIAAIINNDSVQKTGETIYDGDSILPVGKIVYEDLSKDEYFINQIEYKEKLSRTDFYIDMLGEGGKVSQEDYAVAPTIIIQIVTVLIAFPIFHAIGSKIGIFPYFFPPKEKKKSEWD